MGSNQSTSSEALLDQTNNLYESSSTACIGTCNAIQTSPTIVLNNTTVGGSIDITNKCEASASCVMQSTLDSQVENIMSSISKQQNITTQLLPIAFDFQNKNTSSEIKQNITNNITQTMQAVCQATDNTLQSNPTIVGSNATVGGSLTLTNEGSANANCTITNLARISLFNSSTTDDNNVTKQANVFGIMMIAIVIIMVLGVIMLVIVIGPVGVAALVGGGKSKSGEGNGESSELDALLSENGGEGDEGGGGGGMFSSLMGGGSKEGGGLLSSLEGEGMSALESGEVPI